MQGAWQSTLEAEAEAGMGGRCELDEPGVVPGLSSFGKPRSVKKRFFGFLLSPSLSTILDWNFFLKARKEERNLTAAFNQNLQIFYGVGRRYLVYCDFGVATFTTHLD